MDVFFEPSTGQPFSIEVGFFDTISEIKEKIQKYEGIPVAKQTLIFNGQILPDDSDVASCELLQFSRVYLLVSTVPAAASFPNNNPEKTPAPPLTAAAESPPPSQPPPQEKIQLLLRMPAAAPSSTSFSIEMDPSDAVSRLKEKIHEIEPSAPPSSLVLRAKGGAELLDHKSLRDSDLSHLSEIDVAAAVTAPAPAAAQPSKISPSPPPTPTAAAGRKLRVLVQPKVGNTKIPVEVSAGDCVGELRKELLRLQEQLHFHLPPEGFFFIHKQNVMEDDRSFRWHHVAPGDTIEIFNGSVTGGN